MFSVLGTLTAADDSWGAQFLHYKKTPEKLVVKCVCVIVSMCCNACGSVLSVFLLIKSNVLFTFSNSILCTVVVWEEHVIIISPFRHEISSGS